MRRNVHACGHRAVVVDKTPRTDQRTLLLRKCALYPDRPRPTKRDLSWMQHLGTNNLCSVALDFGRRSFKVAHFFPLPRGPTLRRGVGSADTATVPPGKVQQTADRDR